MMSTRTNYLTTRDVAESTGVTMHTVRDWIKKGWIPANSNVAAKRRVGRYKIEPDSLAALNTDMLQLLPSLRKYVPRERAKRQATQVQQQVLPGIDTEP